MSDNPNFYPGMSSDEVYFGQDMTICLTDVVNDKSDVDHTHVGYATTSSLAGKADANHTHSEYATVATLNGKADLTHTHTDKADVEHTHTGVYDLAGTAQTKADEALVSAKSYADGIKNDLLNGAGSAYDTLKELGDLIDENVDAIDALETVAAGKADASHTHSEYATVTSLNGKADASHTHNNYAATNHTHADKADSTHTHSEYATTTALAGKADASHTHSEYATVTALNGKAASNHSHTQYALANATTIKTAGEDLNDYETAGIYSFAQSYTPVNIPAGTNGWLIVIPWENGSGTVKQFWLRHGTVGSNDFEVYVRTKIATYNVWGSWSKFYTTSNPPTPAEVGAAPAFTNASGGVEFSYSTGNTVDLLEEISDMSQGVHTVYSLAGTTNNPKTTESWRLLIHKTSATIGWIMAFGSSGSIYTNYQTDVNTYRGWRCLYEATNSNILWTGASYMTSTNGNPQTITPSKKLSECNTGWLLLWSDYDASTNTANDSDFCTTYIPKFNPAGGKWGGKAFLCNLPTYVGGDAADLSTQVTVIKPIYVHDDCIKGSYQNTSGGRNDVVLRAVYEV